MKSVCRTNLKKPSQSLIKSIYYPNEKKFSNAATKWGCEHEKCAVDEYKKKMMDIHDNFSVIESGLFLNTSLPHLGASPEAIVNCDCFGENCLEGKCPFCIKEEPTDDNTAEKTCLQVADGKLKLKRDHQYYYQVQAQLLVCDKEYSDFVVWTLKGLHIERIECDKNTFDEMTHKSTELFKTAILPELVGKYFSKPLQPVQPVVNQASSSCAVSVVADEETFCICKGPEQGEKIACDDENCKIVCFHFDCVGLKHAPKGNWYCSQCGVQKRKGKKKVLKYE